ncbi:MAG: hypothetical protein ABFS34_06315 [Gemmatimonadota bacterium]
MSPGAELRGGPVVRGLDPEAEARAEAGAAYRAVLDPLEELLGVDAADRIWAFPPREIRGVPAALLVASAFAEQPGRRRLVTARLVVEQLPEGASRRREPSSHVEVVEQGEVPQDRVPGLLEGVVRRLGEDLVGRGPRAFEIGGAADKWADMRTLLAAEPLVAEPTPIEP